MSSQIKTKKKSLSKALDHRLRLFLTGLSMGMADLVPGVSGGTIAILYGIYNELIYSIRVITGTAPRLLLKGDFKGFLSKTPFSFILPIAAGMFVAIFGLAGIFSFLLTTYPVMMWSVFFGLVLGSTFIVCKRVSSWTRRRILLAFAGFITTYLLLGLPSFSVSPTTFVVFATGAIASCAMILPGISGSLIMVMLGQYKNVIGFVSERNIGQLIVFATGALFGLALFSRLLGWLLKNHHNATVATLVGIMLGSLRRVWPWQNEIADNTYTNYLPVFNTELLFSLLLMVAGFVLVIFLEKQGLAHEHNDDIQLKDFKAEISSQHD